MRELASQIYATVESGKLKEPFRAASVRIACPGWAEHTYSTFLAKHAVGNGKTTELFVRVTRGLYRLRPK
jgi:hypothetical protein